MAGIIVTTIVSMVFTRVAQRLAGLLWQKLPYIEDIIPTKYFWAKITGRPPIRYEQFDEIRREIQPIRRESRSRVVRTITTEKHGPGEYSKMHESLLKRRPIA